MDGTLNSFCRHGTELVGSALAILLTALPASAQVEPACLETGADIVLSGTFTDVSYAFCIYDSSGSTQPLLSAVVPPGGTCGPAAIPCWSELTGFGPPLFYLDGNRTQGGIVQLRLKPGATDNTRITTRARGENLTLPATPLTAPVIVQLQGSHGECFTASYDSFIKKNEDGKFRARPEPTSTTVL